MTASLTVDPAVPLARSQSNSSQRVIVKVSLVRQRQRKDRRWMGYQGMNLATVPRLPGSPAQPIRSLRRLRLAGGGFLPAAAGRPRRGTAGPQEATPGCASIHAAARRQELAGSAGQWWHHNWRCLTVPHFQLVRMRWNRKRIRLRQLR